MKGDANDDYKFVVQLYNPSDITKGTENIDKDQGSISYRLYGTLTEALDMQEN